MDSFGPFWVDLDRGYGVAHLILDINGGLW